MRCNGIVQTHAVQPGNAGIVSGLGSATSHRQVKSQICRAEETWDPLYLFRGHRCLFRGSRPGCLARRPPGFSLTVKVDLREGRRLSQLRVMQSTLSPRLAGILASRSGELEVARDWHLR